MAIPSAESRLPLVTLFDSDPIVGVLHVNLREVITSTHTVQDLANQRQRMSILNRDLVQTPVVDTQSEGPILLGDKQNGGPRGALRRPNPPLRHHFFKELPKLRELGLRKWVNRTVRGLTAILQVNGVICGFSMGKDIPAIGSKHVKPRP